MASPLPVTLDFMRTFLSRQWKLIMLLVLLASWLALFPVWARRVTTNPLDEAITLSPNGKIEKDIRVIIPENYQLNLAFERAGVSFEKMKSLLGDWTTKDGKPIPSGVVVPIRWSLRKPNGEVVVSGEVDSFGSIAWSAAEVDRKVGHIKVEPGKYIFSAEILRDVPEFADIKSRISMRLYPKASSTWKITLVWWGIIVNALILWPMAIVIGLLLLWRAYLTLRCKDVQRAARP